MHMTYIHTGGRKKTMGKVRQAMVKHNNSFTSLLDTQELIEFIFVTMLNPATGCQLPTCQLRLAAEQNLGTV
jgi:hypothetical protein